MSKAGWRQVVLGALVALGVGVTAGSLLVPTPRPLWAEVDGVSQASVAVTAREFDDARAVPAAAEVAEARELVLPRSGVLRKAGCVVGATLVSGSVPFLVDDRPLLALHTSTPLWRDLAVGARGDDVLALQEELVRLGYDVPLDSAYGQGTVTAVKALWNSVSAPKQTSMPVDQVIWLPAAEVVVSECPLQVGQRIAAGTKAVVTGGGLESLRLQLDVPVAGERTAVASGQVTVPVPADGVVTDPAFLQAYSQTRTFADYRTDPSKGLTVQVRLTLPVQVVAVPPSSLYYLTGSSGCVLADGSPTKVQVVASELGQSLVAADPLPARVRVDPGSDAPACG